MAAKAWLVGRAYATQIERQADRDLSPGAKFADMDHRHALAGDRRPREVAAGNAELKNRKTGNREELPFDQVTQRFG